MQEYKEGVVYLLCYKHSYETDMSLYKTEVSRAERVIEIADMYYEEFRGGHNEDECITMREAIENLANPVVARAAWIAELWPSWTGESESIELLHTTLED